MAKKLMVHQVYGTNARRTACGKNTKDLPISLPGKKVTCRQCIIVEKSRKLEQECRIARFKREGAEL